VYTAFFISPDFDPDRAIMLGIEWLLEQPGEPLVLLHARKMVDNNRTLAGAVRARHLRCEAPQTMRRSGHWAGGGVLAPWASADVLRCIDGDLAQRAVAVCVIGWRPDDPEHAAWIAARKATDLISGRMLGRAPEMIVGDPVIRIALDQAERWVNHNNALVQAEDKAYLVRTLQELVRGGHVFDLDQMAAYAMATGWTGEEVKRIREYGQRVLDGRGVRLASSIGPQPGACARWEAEAAQAREG
jgi:hypothetical protein